MNDEQARQKVAKLMALGTNGAANQHEAEAAMRQAAWLMRKHNIEQAEVMAAAASGSGAAYQWTTARVALDPTRRSTNALTWLGTLALAVARATDTIVAYVRDPRSGMHLQFQGEATDVAYAVWLAEHLRDTCRAESARYPGPRGDRETFRRAMVRRLSERLQQLTQERRDALKEAVVPTARGDQTTALVVTDHKITLRDERFGRQRVRYTSRRRYGDSYAAQAGRAAGDRTALNKAVTGTRSLMHD